MANKMAGVLAANGAQHVAVVYGHDGLDELSTAAPSTMVSWTSGASGVVESVVDASAFGLAPATLADLRGGGRGNQRRPGSTDPGRRAGTPTRDIVVLNVAAGLLVGGLVTDLGEGVELAVASLDSGAAAGALEALVEVSQAARSTL